MSALDIFQHGDTFVVSSEAVAEGSGVQHKNVLELIDANRDDFEDFGQVAFETRAGYNNAQVRVALLNEQQATLLMTYQRNTDQVRAFKRALVKAFFEMARMVVAPALTEDQIVHQALTILVAKTTALESKVTELEPLAAQARTHNLGKGLVTRQDFAREISTWALTEGFRVTSPQVMEFLGRKLDLFIVGDRSDQGQSTMSGVRRGLSVTTKGTSPRNGYAYATGKLTAKGVEYAWARIEAFVREHGNLELPKKGIAA